MAAEPTGARAPAHASKVRAPSPPSRDSRTVHIIAGPDAIRCARSVVPGRARWPHHSCSTASMVGHVSADQVGILSIALGECVLAHGCTLVLSDLPEWRRDTVQAVGVAWRERRVTLHGSGGPIQVRADFQLVATHELCPCGMRGRAGARCTCTVGSVARWEARCREFVKLLEWGAR